MDYVVDPEPTLFRGDIDAGPVVARLTDRAMTIGIGDDEVVSWDRAGRLFSMWTGGRTARRGLNGRGLEKWRDAAGRHRRSIEGGALDVLVDRAAGRAQAVAEALAARRCPEAAARSTEGADLPEVLDRAARFDASAARADAQRFSGIYGEIGMLPPDQYLAMVVHATEGCAFNTCAFCELYGRPFRVRTTAEFAGHLAEVRAYLGDSLLLRSRAVFLGAANAVALPAARLLPMLQMITEMFGGRPPGISGFVDARSGARKSSGEYGALAAAGLRRVYVGLESGHDPLLAFVRKPSTSDEAVQAVRAIKSAGIQVGVIVIVGLGGDRFADAHVSDTVATLNNMAAGAGDLIYFSDLVEPHDGQYAALAAAASIGRLTPEELVAQQRRIRAGLAFSSSPPTLATYDMGEFVY